MEFLFCLLPFGGALAARLGNRHWQFWLVWAGTGLVSFLLTWLVADQKASHAAWLVAGASFLGFIAPAVWEGFENLLRRPRTLAWLVGGGTIAALFFTNPQAFWRVVWGLAVIIIMIIGFMIIIRALLFPPRGKRR